MVIVVADGSVGKGNSFRSSSLVSGFCGGGACQLEGAPRELQAWPEQPLAANSDPPESPLRLPFSLMLPLDITEQPVPVIAPWEPPITIGALFPLPATVLSANIQTGCAETKEAVALAEIVTLFSEQLGLPMQSTAPAASAGSG